MPDHDTTTTGTTTSIQTGAVYGSGDYVHAVADDLPAGGIRHLVHPGPAAWTVIECWWDSAAERGCGNE